MHVFTPATKTGKWNGGGGQWPGAAGLTTRAKKSAAKNDPNSIASEAMKSSIPSTVGAIRELWFAAGGPWCSCAWAVIAPLR